MPAAPALPVSRGGQNIFPARAARYAGPPYARRGYLTAGKAREIAASMAFGTLHTGYAARNAERLAAANG